MKEKVSPEKMGITVDNSKVGTGYRGSKGTKQASGRHVTSREQGYASGMHKSKILSAILTEFGSDYFTEENIENQSLLSPEQQQVWEKYHKTVNKSGKSVGISINKWTLIMHILKNPEWSVTSGCITDKGIQACEKPGSGTCILPRSESSSKQDDYKYGHAQVWLKYFENALGKKIIDNIDTLFKLVDENPFEIMKDDAQEVTQVVNMVTSQQTQQVVSPTEIKIVGIGSKKEIEEELIPRGEDIANYVKDSNYRLLEIAWNTDRPQHILIDGHKGTGKTQLVRTFAHDNNVPCVTLDCSNETSEEHLKGSLINLGTYQLGVIPKAFEVANKYGECILHLDEMSCLLKTEQKLLNSLLDWRTEISIPECNKVYKLKKGVKLLVVGTMNPLTSRNDYEVEKLNPDLKSRFIQLQLLYPKSSELWKIIEANFKGNKEFIKMISDKSEMTMKKDEDSTKYSILGMMVQLAQETQQKDVGYVYSPRDIVNALRFLLVAYMYNVKESNQAWITELPDKFRSKIAERIGAKGLTTASKGKAKIVEAKDKDTHVNSLLVALRYTCTQLVRKADPDEQDALADIVNAHFSQMIGDIKVEN